MIDSCGEFLEQWKTDDRFESVPLVLTVGGENIVDDETFDQAEFLKKVAACEECPKSACPSPERYMKAFECDAERIYAITLSSELSGSYNSAVLGKNLLLEEHPEKKIYVFNSRSASVGETLIAMKIEECEKAGNPDMVFKFCSTSKVTFPGSGIAAISASKANLDFIKKQMSVQTIGHDKLNQLRHARFFGDFNGMLEHMKKHADIIRPKFEAVLEMLDKELGDLGIAKWTKPNGGYFIGFDTMDGCAKKVVAMCKDAGVVMTPAGATYPYGKDPHDSNIRIAPTFPSTEELKQACEIFVTCVKLVSLDKILETK